MPVAQYVPEQGAVQFNTTLKELTVTPENCVMAILVGAATGALKVVSNCTWGDEPTKLFAVTVTFNLLINTEIGTFVTLNDMAPKPVVVETDDGKPTE